MKKDNYEIVIGDKRYSVSEPVHLWTETGMDFHPGQGARKRIQKIDLVVWHWTGGEGRAKQLYDVLRKRNLGIEFFIQDNGEIWQFCDPTKVDTWDAGSLNPKSVGIEIQNYGIYINKETVPMLGKGRMLYETFLNGHKRTFSNFWPIQINSALSLANTLSDAFQIPKKVPTDQNGNLLTRMMTSEKLKNFSGHIGHFHCDIEKSDPGTDLLKSFMVAWS